MIVIRKHFTESQKKSEDFEKKMRRKYGATYFIDMSDQEKDILERLNSDIEFDKISADGKTFDCVLH